MPQSEQPATAAAARTAEQSSGLGKVLIAVYLVLAIAATFRSVYQILTKFDEAPLAYSLSAVAGLVYIVATVALIKRGHGAWRAVARWALVFELCGVLIVGTLSLIAPQLFAHPSVWSQYGIGYVFIPLVLPVLGLLWLRSTGREAAGAPARGEGSA
ncbi:hypothetical protein [Leucobacter tenebrionis]|uniref:hypothetical protein n=1 Tax=Leucobacter tenebrionis TaxID=2873270 RepID=UPI002106F795|nr:hypothetical protein [Leucobacter tenebrionis]